MNVSADCSKSVDVLIPCFNGEPFIEQAIQSVLSQTFDHITIAVVDDGSTDETPNILARYRERIKLLGHPGGANQGAPRSLNMALRETRSPYVAFLDADDLFYPDKIASQVSFLEEHQDHGLVFTNGDIVGDDGHVLYPLFPTGWKMPRGAQALLLNCFIRTPSMVMVRRAMLDRCGGAFDENLQYTKDHDMWLRIAERSNIGYLHQHLTAYRQHGGQQSARRHQWDEGFTVLKNATMRYAYGSSAYRKRLAVLHYRIAEHERQSGALLTAAYSYCSAFACDPLRALRVLLRGNV